MKAAALLILLAGADVAAQIPSDDSSSPRAAYKALSVPLLRALPLHALAPLALSKSNDGTIFVPEISTTTEAAMVEDARSLFVELRFRLVPYDASSGVDQGRFWKRNQDWGFEQKARDREFITIAGARSPEPGVFAVPLFDYDIERLEELTVIDSEGREHAAKPLASSRHGEEIWFEAPGLAGSRTPPLVPGEPKGPSRQARMAKEDDASRVSLSGWYRETEAPTRGVVFRRKSKDAVKHEFIDKEIGLVFDSSGAWRGWLGKPYGSRELLSPLTLRADTLSWVEGLRLRREAESRAKRTLPVLRLLFQAEGESSAWEEDKVSKERMDVGFPLAPKLIFCARSLSPKEVKALKSVEVVIDGKPMPASFIGVLTKGVVGYLVAPERPLASLEPVKAPDDGELAMAIEPFALTSALQVWAYLDRLEGVEAGYAGEKRRKPRYLSAVGGVLANLNGRPAAIMVEQARSEAAAEKKGWQRPAPLLRLHSIEELAKAFADPARAVDARFKPDALDKRRAWLGAETQDITPDLAKLLDIAWATRGGTIGQLVTEIIDGSPGARAGLKAGDVLLRVQEDGKRQAIAIPGRKRFDVSLYEVGSTGAARYFRRANTGLDDVLADFGPGTGLTLTYARGGKERSASLELAASPPGIESAPKLTDKATGLSVKEITADARRLLRLDKRFEGLLIYAVEPGSPAGIAGLSPFGLLLAVDGKSVSTLKDLEALFAAKRSGSVPSVNVRSLYMGQPVYADLRLAP